MKRRICAVMSAVAVLLACAPALSGCSAKVGYELNTDADGNKYYVASCSGFASALKGALVIPEYYGEGAERAPVTEIANNGFSGTKITEVTIPATVTKIGTAAFAYDYSLTKVTFAADSAVTAISRGTFGYCRLLSEIELPDTVRSIGVMAFYNCESLKSLTVPEGVTDIYAEAFENCSNLAHVSLPETLTTIGELAFYNSGLCEIVIPDSVRDTVSDKLDEEGNPVFGDDGERQTVTTFGIGYGAFHTCVNLETAVVGNGITVLRSGVFGYCPALTEIYLPASLTAVEGAYVSGGSVIYGHPFHNDAALADVYFGGTQEQWTALLGNVDATSASEQGARYDNSALLNASVHFDSAYVK